MFRVNTRVCRGRRGILGVYVCMYVCMYRRDSTHTQTQSARSVLISLPEDPSCAVVVAPVLVEEGLDGVGLIGLGCIQVA